MKKTLLTALMALATSGSLFAQNELSNFTATGRAGVINTFATDYQVIGINPANLGRSTNALFAFSVGEVGAGVSSKSLTHTQLNDFIYHSDQKLTQQQKQEFATAFNNENAMNVNTDISTLAISFKFPKFGAIAVSNRWRVTGHMGLNKNGAEILFLGKDAPLFQNYQPNQKISIRETLEPTTIQSMFINEWNAAYGIQVVNTPEFKLQLGAGYKYLQGVGVVEIVVDGESVTAYSALSPKFDVNYGDLIHNPKFNAAGVGGGFFDPVGKGNGFDFGAAAEFGKKWKAGVSVVDLGNMDWSGNLLVANDQYIQKVTSTGINSFNFFKEVVDFTASGTDSLFNYTPGSKLVRSLPTQLRTGIGYVANDKFRIGFDSTVPLNNVAGNMPTPYFGLGFDYKVLPLLRLSSGVSHGAGYGTNVALGATFVTPVYEFGVATRDVLGFFTDDNPYFSIAFGFLRFKFGGSDAQ